MLMDYWSDSRLNHHTEATSMLYAARECARIVVDEGLERRFDRHARASRAMTAGLAAMDLELFGDQAHKMPNVTGVHIPDGVPGDAVRAALLENFGLEIGTSFGPLHGRIWRIGTMGYGCRRDNVMTLPRGAGGDAAAVRPRERAGRGSGRRARGRGIRRRDGAGLSSLGWREANPPTRLPSDRRDMCRSHSIFHETVTVIPVAASCLSSENPLRKLGSTGRALCAWRRL